MRQSDISCGWAHGKINQSISGGHRSIGMVDYSIIPVPRTCLVITKSKARVTGSDPDVRQSNSVGGGTGWSFLEGLTSSKGYLQGDNSEVVPWLSDTQAILLAFYWVHSHSQKQHWTSGSPAKTGCWKAGEISEEYQTRKRSSIACSWECIQGPPSRDSGG
ncbi:hypothetical protein FA13DRAFT_1714231 [Coprinellus micaceus]|uniref:Uncharacterized protein n=1 Tax=Coprinellus micaceus TaxID=71717 RepID=A0A4Y7SSU1_COPMI|nr:hypothetical protein FA13DRAFT_1717376 [Coprinellus micaceus]TEB24925.1 hypothetical protein FA13DRAFT_1714231 [Coprinellus micaceus]